jgi:hypothetical protein
VAGWFLGKFFAYILSLFVLDRFCPCLQVLITEATLKELVPEPLPVEAESKLLTG